MLTGRAIYLVTLNAAKGVGSSSSAQNSVEKSLELQGMKNSE